MKKEIMFLKINLFGYSNKHETRREVLTPVCKAMTPDLWHLVQFELLLEQLYAELNTYLEPALISHLICLRSRFEDYDVDLEYSDVFQTSQEAIASL
jgi:hypothetical protein